ncbi:AsnC family transcriptional regulator [Nocardioides nitrophenolicus]|uniref:AsnC family transcriptional regulator n=1 Tax=Nocardioides nitrophenolicus TaxID=60489 RepID=UPI0019569371|nr:AsnC family transcriptional regulator [Nocardioides nitrophenolicus]MBM7520033.1 DNA-binding Lrp family transcriptional regulator [Nocardioides nitrophenolicus]
MTSPDDEIDQLAILPEIDLALIDALQVHPRAPWTTIASVLDIDAVTAARRWRRLYDERLAWWVVRPSAARLSPYLDATLALLRCPASAAERAAVPEWAHTVDLLSGSADLGVVVLGSGLAEVHRRVDELAALTGGEVVERRVVAAVHAEDSGWRLGICSAAQRRALLPRADRPVPTPPRSEVVDELLAALGDDARLSGQELAARVGGSEPTVRRALDRALRSGALQLGCDLATPAAGLGRGVLLEVEVDDPDRSGRALAAAGAVHRCVQTVGAGNLTLGVRLASLAHLPRTEAELAALAPGWRVRSRQTVLRPVKRQGLLLDASGRRAAPRRGGRRGSRAG